MNKQPQYFIKKPYRAYVFCGLMAGIAEVIWAYFYTASHTINFSQVGAEITKSVLGNKIANLFLDVTAGLFIHIILSVFIGIFYGFLVSSLKNTKFFSKIFLLYFYSITMLVCIWWLAYFVLLPILNQNFILLIPASSAIYSKLLFGVTMATFYLKTKES